MENIKTHIKKFLFGLRKLSVDEKASGRKHIAGIVIVSLVLTMVSSFIDIKPAYAAATYIQTVTASDRKTTTTAGTLSLTAAITPTSGNLLIAALSLKTTPTATPTISGWDARDSICNTVCTYVFTKIATSSASQNITVNVSASGKMSGILSVIEYSAAVNTYVNATTKTGTSSAPDTGTITTTKTDQLVFAVFAGNNGNNYGSFTNSFTERANAKFTTGGTDYQLNIGYAELATNTAGSYSTVTSFGGTAEWASIIFKFDSVASASSDIAVTKTVDSSTPAVGDTVTYTLTATNNGSSDNTGVQITDAVPSGLTYVSSSPASGTTYTSSTGIWNIGDISNGASKTLTISATVNAGQGGNVIANTATKTAANVTDPTAGNNSASVNITVQNVTATPVVTSPIYTGATSVSGTSSEANGTTITVYVNGVSAGTTTVSGGAWTKSVSALSDGNTVYATALASSKSLSANSSTVTVSTPQSAAPVVNSPILPGATTVSGTSSEADGTTITVYADGSSLGTTTVTSGTWSKSVSALSAAVVITAKATATNKSISNASNSVTVANQSDTPVITSTSLIAGDTSITGTSSEANGTTITVYVNGSSVGTTTVSSNAWTKTVSALSGGDIVTAKATASSEAISNASNSVTVLYISATPVVTSPILVGATSVSGTSSEANGTTITVYVDSVSVGTTTASGGVWTKSSLTALTAGQVITATATASAKAVSATSSPVTVQAQSATPTVTSPIIVGATTVSGTSSEANGTTITVYVDGSSVGTTTVTSGAWTKSSLTALTAGQVVTAKATASGKAISNASDSVTVLARSAAPVVTSPITAGSVSISGTSSEADDTTIDIYCARSGGNCSSASLIGSTTVSSGTWTLSVNGTTFTSATLRTSDTVTAKATASGKAVSLVSASVTVTNATSPIPTVTSPIVAGSSSVSGLSSGADGTTIEVFRTRSSTTTSLGTITVTDGAWSLTSLSTSTLKAGDTITAKARIDTNNDGSNNGSDVYSSSSTIVTVITPVSPVPTVSSPIISGATSVSGTSTGPDGTPGTLIEVFRTRSAVSTSLGTVAVTAGAWTLSGISGSLLRTGDTVTARARIDTNGNSVNNNGDSWSSLSSSITVAPAISPVPTVNAGILAGDTSISGTSTGPSGTPGTVVEVFVTRDGSTASLGTTTVSTNTWTLPGLETSTLRTGDIVTARARVDTNNDGSNNSSDDYSSLSSGVTVANRVSQAPSVNELLAGATSISGTSTGPNGTVIKVYVNSIQVGATTVSGGTWTLSPVTTLVEDDLVTATATVDTNNDGSINGSDSVSATSSPVTVEGLPITAAPAVDPPIVAKDTSITGTSTEANGTTITVFVNGESIGTTTVTSGIWSKSVDSEELQAGESVTATALASGKTVSSSSTSITVLSLVSPTPTVIQPLAGDTVISGTSSGPNGTTVEVLRKRSGSTVSIGTTTVSGNAWTLSSLSGSTLRTSDIITARARIDTNNDGSNNGSDVYSASSSEVTVAGLVSEAPAVNDLSEGSTSISGTSTGADGTVIKVYVNNSLVGTATVSTGTWTLSPVTALSADDLVKATATFDTNNDGTVDETDAISAYSSTITVAGAQITAAPAVDQPRVAGDTTISGTSSEANGTTIRVYINSELLVTDTISVSGGVWSVTVPADTLQAEEIITATATATEKSASAPSTEIAVLSLTSPTPTVDALTVSATTVTGTSTGSGGTIIKVLRTRGEDTTTLGTATVVDGEWSFTISGSYVLQGGDVITAQALIDTNNDGSVTEEHDIYSSTSSEVTVVSGISDAPAVNELSEGSTSISGTSTGPDGTLITVYVNSEFVGTGTVVSGSWTVSPITALETDDEVTATATFDTNNDGIVDGDDSVSASSSTVIVAGLPVSAVPAVNPPLIAGDTTISGTSIEESGTVIKVYIGDAFLETTTITVTDGEWSITVPVDTLQAGEIVTATATAEGKNVSSHSTGIEVLALTSPTPTVDPITAAETSISGTSSGTGGTVIKVLRTRDEETITLGTTTVGSGSWTLSDLTGSTLQADDIITAQALIDTNNDSTISEEGDVFSSTSSEVIVLALSSPTPSVHEPTTGDTSISGESVAADGTIIKVFRKRSEVTITLGTTTVLDNDWTLEDLSGATLETDDIITAQALIDTNNDCVINEESDIYSALSSEVTVQPLNTKEITSFTFPDWEGDITGTTITVVVPFGTDVSSLTPTIEINGVSVSPASGVARDFTEPVHYIVTAADDSTQEYIVTVVIADGIAPTVESATPADTETGVSLNTAVVVHFSKAMDTDSFEISDDNRNHYTQTTWSSGNTVATSVHSPWTKGTLVHVTIDGQSADDLPLSGSGYSWSFTTNPRPLFDQDIPLMSSTNLDLSGVINEVDEDNNITINDEPQPIDDVSSGDLHNIDFSLIGDVSDQTVHATHAATVNSTGEMTIHNDDDLSNVTVNLPNDTTVFSGDCWDGNIALFPGSSEGTAPSGFSVGGTVIELGSTCGVLLLDQPITILFTDVTGPVGYKATGSNVWVSISECSGTYDDPILDPPVDTTTFGECSISNGADTKIVSYHLTTFGQLLSGSSSSSSSSNDSSEDDPSQSGGTRGSAREALVLNAITNIAKIHAAAKESKLSDIVDECSDVVPPKPESRLGHLIVHNMDGIILFRDVPISNWFASFIGNLAVKNILSGYLTVQGKTTGIYAPNKPVTIAEVLKMAMEALQKNPTSTVMPKNRSAKGNWAGPYASRAEELKLPFLKIGMNVHMPASRSLAIEIFSEVAGIDLKNVSTEKLYRDVPSGLTHAAAIDQATRLCWIHGDTDARGALLDRFRPHDLLNRAEAAKILSIILIRGN